MKRSERKKGVDGVVEEDQQGRGNWWKHKSDEEGRNPVLPKKKKKTFEH